MTGNKRWSIAVFSCAGIVSGILTLNPPLPSGGGIFLGAIFGVALSVCLLIFHPPRSIGRATAVTISSTTAYIAAMYSTIFAYEWLPRPSQDTPGADPPSYIMAVGGVIGALILSASVLLLYRNASTKLGKAVLICTLAGGALGVFGYSLGFLFANRDPNRPQDMPGMIPLYIVWQTGIACLLAAFLPEPVTVEAKESFGEVSILNTSEPSPPQETAVPLPVWGEFLIGFIGLALTAFIARIAWFKYEFARQKDEFTQYQMSHPPLYDLPPIEPISGEDAVPLHPIAGTTAQLLGPSSNKATVSKPTFVDFRVCYMHLPNERCGGNPPDVEVEVTRWPNSAWASYEMEGIHYGSGAGYFIHPKKIEKFGNTIAADENPKEPGKGRFYWVSGPTLVVVKSSISDPDEFIKEYLDRYPPL